ncbi:immunity protein YezG family protein [Gimesia sp.]|uniref:immunity protein YezG family protein n=1 Tax=Gimesia sp. TaxID=2024833 RepID=UPI003A9018CA
MIEGIERFYQEIAESIQDAIPEEWATARMDAVFYPDGSRYFGEFTRKADGVARSFTTNRQGERAFREIRKLFKNAGQPLWSKASFELNAEGKFDMKWEYDDSDENGYAIFDEEREKKEFEERYKRLTR